jgi:pyruvate,orthophosphate dikinase
VAGIRTPQEITKLGSERWAELAGVSEVDRVANFMSMEEFMPEYYAELHDIQLKLERHYKDMQDIEFTIQEGKLWLLQTRSGKRTGKAMVRIAMEMMREGLISETDALKRIDPYKLDELLHPEFEKEALKKAQVFAKGLAASPGAATGQVVFTADDAVAMKKDGKKVILVRVETSPEDIAGMDAAEGILTARGGMTSHAAVVARGMGKCCVSGAGTIKVDYKTKVMNVDGFVIKEGDWISLNGSTGDAIIGKIETSQVGIDQDFEDMLTLADKYATMKVRTNADTPHDSQVARKFGAIGIGLCRTEHMFFEGEKIVAMREMILADDEKGRREALGKLLPIQRKDFEGIFEAMQGLPVTVRLLDPPLHEFVPHDAKGQEQMAEVMGISVQKIKQKVEDLSEFNPMLGHRGCRLGNTYPEITEMQTRAIIEAALDLKAKGITAVPEIMVPLTGTLEEMQLQEKIVRDTIAQIFAERNDSIAHLVGTMIEIPRAALVADKIAQSAEFFSFGTNDLTQMTFGYSRDDAGKFLPVYLEKGILKKDPFEVLDQEGVGQLVKMACERGKQTRPDIKLGICGEHGGEPSSIEFCHKVGLNYVSCSPYRVPIARLVAGQVVVKQM